MNKEILKKNFEDHGFTTQFFETGKEAADYLKDKLHKRTIGFGGSVTLKEIGLYDALSEDNVVIWHHKLFVDEVKRLAANTKIYVTSANGVSETGEIVNIDGVGNRIAYSVYGPEQVYYIVGKNKITPDLSSAMYRAKNVAAPKNAQRLNAKTPCAVKGDKCYDCKSPDRLCKCTVILDRAPGLTPSEVIFVNEDLGF